MASEKYSKEAEYQYILAAYKKNPEKMIRIFSSAMSIPADERTAKVHTAEPNHNCFETDLCDAARTVKKAEELLGKNKTSISVEFRSWGEESNFYNNKMIALPIEEAQKRIHKSPNFSSTNLFIGEADPVAVILSICAPTILPKNNEGKTDIDKVHADKRNKELEKRAEILAKVGKKPKPERNERFKAVQKKVPNITPEVKGTKFDLAMKKDKEREYDQGNAAYVPDRGNKVGVSNYLLTRLTCNDSDLVKLK